MGIHQDEDIAPAFSSYSSSSVSPKETGMEMEATTNVIDLRTCAPDELASYLLSYRFDGDAMSATSFLLECATALPDSEGISARLMGKCVDDDDDDDEGEDEGEDCEDCEDCEKMNDHHDDGANPRNDAVATTASSPSLSTSSSPTSSRIATLRRIESSPSSISAFVPNDNDTGGDGGGIAMGHEVSCINPRGKFRLSLYRDGIVLTDARDVDGRVPIAREFVDDVVVFRRPEDYRNMKRWRKDVAADGRAGVGKRGGNDAMPGHVVLICFRGKVGMGKGGNVVEHKGKPLSQVCFQLPSYGAGGGGGSSHAPRERDWLDGLSSALLGSTRVNDGKMIRVRSTMDVDDDDDDVDYGASGRYAFRSSGEEGGGSTTTEDMPYVGCYRGFHDGALFPLEEGLLFFKPPLFVHRSKLASISCGRGAGGSRYVDMIATIDDVAEGGTTTTTKGGKKKSTSPSYSSALEFTNIHRGELSVLNDYVHGVLIPAMRSDANDDRGTTTDVGRANGARDVSFDEEGGEGKEDDDDDDDDDADDDHEDVAVAVVVDDRDHDTESADAVREGRRGRPTRAASRAAREINRAAVSAPSTAAEERDGDIDDDESEEFREEDESSDDDDDSEVTSDGESVSSVEEEEEEEEEYDGESTDGEDDLDDDGGDSDDSDGTNYDDRKTKRARAG
jgi:hypothetical protein